MSAALDVALATPWQRQGEWGGTTLSRSLTYAGMQRSLFEWTGVKEGYEAFLHSGETTYIAAGQFERFASAYLALLERERRPLHGFVDRFATLLTSVRLCTRYASALSSKGRDTSVCFAVQPPRRRATS